MVLLPYNIECYPNIFTMSVYNADLDELIQFEISWRKNDYNELLKWCDYWGEQIDTYHVGYNSIGYDYPLLHHILTNPLVNNPTTIYEASASIINTPWHERFTNQVPAWKQKVKQMDLFKIHHFDNESRRCSLNQLEFVMRLDSIQGQPFPVDIPIPETDDAADILLRFDAKHAYEAGLFLKKSMPAIEFRKTLSEKYDMNLTNHNDTKIGKSYFIMCLENANIQCFDSNRNPRQTWRDHINLRDIIFPYIKFIRPEFQAVLNSLNNTTITETKGALKIQAELDDFTFVFALGGIHGSVESETFYSDDEMVITDADAKAYYPRISIENRIYPEHLSEMFCDVNKDVYDQRQLHEGGSVENRALKLAGNGTYGDSNSKFSPFYDPKFTMTTTVNGQLMLCMLAEQLMRIPDLRMIQINTDGLTVIYPRKYTNEYKTICKWWEQLTQMTLEFVDYKSMHVRDVNNYIAVSVDDKPKYKGAYVYKRAIKGTKDELGWHQNHSAIIVKIAAANAIVKGIPVRETIINHGDIFDFFLLAKVGKKDTLELHDEISWHNLIVFKRALIKQIPNVCRYLITNNGYRLIKTMPKIARKTPKVNMVYTSWQSKKLSNGFNKNLVVSTPYEYDLAISNGYRCKDGGTYDYSPRRNFMINDGYLVQIWNDVTSTIISEYDVNFDFYITEAEKLVNGVIGLK